MNGLYGQLRDLAGESRVLVDEPMSGHTTFRVGGPAAYFVRPQNEEILAEVIRFLNREGEPYYILGNGSNLLVSDEGYGGVIIEVGQDFDYVRADGNEIVAGAGSMLSKIAKSALDHSLTGLEFAAGIPGSLGGAVVMNAGAYGGEMRNVLSQVTLLTCQGDQIYLSPEMLHMDYRRSDIPILGHIVLEAKFWLERGDASVIKARMDELSQLRRTKQPLEYPSAGSTFKRPEGHFAGQLIEQAGLRGLMVGGAQVAEKHCGFVINRGDASAADIYDLCNIVKAKVKAVHDVELELEVKTLGSF